MSYVTQATVWPEPVSLDGAVKDVLGLFYQLADDKSSQAGPRMASEVFTPDATLLAATGVFRGKEGTSGIVYTVGKSNAQDRC
jgi:hypothetical protein